MVFYDMDCSDIVLIIDFANMRVLLCYLNKNYRFNMTDLFSNFKSILIHF